MTRRGRAPPFEPVSFGDLVKDEGLEQREDRALRRCKVPDDYKIFTHKEPNTHLYK